MELPDGDMSRCGTSHCLRPKQCRSADHRVPAWLNHPKVITAFCTTPPAIGISRGKGSRDGSGLGLWSAKVMQLGIPGSNLCFEHIFVELNTACPDAAIQRLDLLLTQYDLQNRNPSATVTSPATAPASVLWSLLHRYCSSGPDSATRPPQRLFLMRSFPLEIGIDLVQLETLRLKRAKVMQ